MHHAGDLNDSTNVVLPPESVEATSIESELPVSSRTRDIFLFLQLTKVHYSGLRGLNKQERPHARGRRFLICSVGVHK